MEKNIITKKIMALELELWQKYYNEQGMRHLFVEYSYYTAQLLNQWMQAEGDEILEDIFRAWSGTSAGGEANRNFLKAIKETCPETVFHGFINGWQSPFKKAIARSITRIPQTLCTVWCAQ